MQLSKSCKLDTYSQGKTVYLDSDVDLSGSKFVPIPTFGGTFEGQGHTVSGLELSGDASHMGLFRYVQAAGTVRDLKVTGNIDAAGMSIGFLSSENTVASIGICLGRGTLISMVLVMCVLPQILLLGDSLVEKTSFTSGLHPATQQLHGAMRVNGHVRGYINGYVDAEIHGRVNGTVSASIDIGDVQMEELPAHVAPPAQLHSEEGSDEET